MTGPGVAGASSARSRDLDRREVGALAPLLLALVLFGFYPMPLLDVINPHVDDTLEHVGVHDPTRHGAVGTAEARTAVIHSRRTTFVKPTIEYGELWPMLVVFGVACLGVLVEAFVPRERRYLAQVVLDRRRPASPRSSASSSSPTDLHVARRRRGPRHARRRGHASPSTARPCSSGAWSWSSRSAACLLFAERRLEGGVSAFAGQAAALPGTEAERQASTRGLDHTEVYPLLLFAVGGMMLFPAANDLLTMFVALEVLSLPLYLLCGLARRRRLLSQEAALKYFLLGAFSSGFFLYGVALIYGYAGSMHFGAINEAVRNDTGNQTLLLHRHGHAGRRPAVQGRRRAVPGLDARRLPGRPDRGHGVHGGGTKVAAFGALLRLFYVAFGARPLDLAADAVGHRDPDHGRRRGARGRPDRHEADARLLLGRAHRLPAHRRARRAERQRRSTDGEITSLQAVLFYLVDLRPRHARRLRRRRAGPRPARRGSDVRALGRARQALAGGGRASSRSSCSRWPASR